MKAGISAVYHRKVVIKWIFREREIAQVVYNHSFKKRVKRYVFGILEAERLRADAFERAFSLGFMGFEREN